MKNVWDWILFNFFFLAQNNIHGESEKLTNNKLPDQIAKLKFTKSIITSSII